MVLKTPKDIERINPMVYLMQNDVNDGKWLNVNALNTIGLCCATVTPCTAIFLLIALELLRGEVLKVVICMLRLTDSIKLIKIPWPDTSQLTYWEPQPHHNMTSDLPTQQARHVAHYMEHSQPQTDPKVSRCFTTSPLLFYSSDINHQHIIRKKW